MRVQPSIAIAAGVGVLALALLLVFDLGDRNSDRSSTQTGVGTDGETHGAPRGASGREQGPTHRAGDPANVSDRTVGGTLIDSETGPLSEGRVDLWCDDGHLASRVRIDADGNFSGPACDGTTCARLVHSVFEQPEAWELEPDVARELAVVAAPGIEGTVVSTSGEPIPDAKILLGHGSRRATARSDTDGDFALALPRARPCDACDDEAAQVHCRSPTDLATDGSANLFVWASTFAPHELEVTLQRETSVRVVLPPPAAPITGRIVGPDGAPVGPRTVVLATHTERDAEQHAAEVDADGSFSFADLAQAHYRLRAIRDGHELAVLDSAAPGDRVELRVAQAVRGRDLRVEVRDDGDRPTPAVRVDGGPFRGVETDARGRVEADDVLPGSYTLSVRVAGCPVFRTKVEVQPGLDAALEIVRLPASCVTSGPD